MVLIYIIAIIAIATIIGVLVWFVLQDPGLKVTSNYATRDEHNPDNYPKY